MLPRGPLFYCQHRVNSKERCWGKKYQKEGNGSIHMVLCALGKSPAGIYIRKMLHHSKNRQKDMHSQLMLGWGPQERRRRAGRSWSLGPASGWSLCWE